MREVYVSLPTVAIVHAFVMQLSTLDGQFDFLSDRYVIDAKSLMGVFKLDLSKPLKLRIERDTKKAMDAIKCFIVDGAPEVKRKQALQEDL